MTTKETGSGKTTTTTKQFRAISRMFLKLYFIVKWNSPSLHWLKFRNPSENSSCLLAPRPEHIQSHLFHTFCQPASNQVKQETLGGTCPAPPCDPGRPCPQWRQCRLWRHQWSWIPGPRVGLLFPRQATLQRRHGLPDNAGYYFQRFNELVGTDELKFGMGNPDWHVGDMVEMPDVSLQDSCRSAELPCLENDWDYWLENQSTIRIGFGSRQFWSRRWPTWNITCVS